MTWDIKEIPEFKKQFNEWEIAPWDLVLDQNVVQDLE